MPRAKRSVGFWRGPAQTNKVALLPAPDRWTGTPVDAWPPNVIREMRRELLAVRRRRPEITEQELVVHANAWLHSNHPPTPTKGKKKGKGSKARSAPRSVHARHVRALLSPPVRRTSKSGRQTPPDASRPKVIDRAPRPTSLSGEEIAEVIRRNLEAAKKPRSAGSSAGHRASRPANAAAASRPANAAAKPAAGKAKRRRKTSKSGKRRTTVPPVAMHAGVSPRGPFVVWPADVPDATRVHLDVRDLRRRPIRTVKAEAAKRYAVFQAPASGFEVLARFLNATGDTVAIARAAHRPGEQSSS